MSTVPHFTGLYQNVSSHVYFMQAVINKLTLLNAGTWWPT